MKNLPLIAVLGSLFLSLQACGPQSAQQLESDGGSDGGPADAGTLPRDAGTSDAGTTPPDAGLLDAGRRAGDAGVTAACSCFNGANATCATRLHLYESQTGCVAAAAVGDTADLFTCAGGVWTQVQACSTGQCNVSPAGGVDTCYQPVNPGQDAGPSCPGGNGAYCGQTLGRDPNTLYDCQNGVVTVKQACGAACVIQPAGTADSCPCPGANGFYCGNDGLSLPPNNLYKCTGGVVSLSTTCAAGCQTMPAGTNDQCKGGCTAAGWFCGNDGLNLDPNVLFHCAAGTSTPDKQTPCAAGCQTMPAGTNDVCKTAQCPGNANGLYCGNDGLNLNANTLYNCQNGAVTTVQVCTQSCVTAPAGTNDHCNSCPAGDGLYCGNDGLGLDPNTLYQCTGGTVSVSQACGAPCRIAPAGQSDSCPGTSCNGLGAAALQWERGQLAAGNSWNSMCLGFVNNAFSQGAGRRYSELQAYSAKDSLHIYQGEGRVTGWSGSCPCGSILFWEANACNNNWGHIVICNGDGTVVTSGWNGFGGSTRASISWLSGQECGRAPAGYVVPQ